MKDAETIHVILGYKRERKRCPSRTSSFCQCSVISNFTINRSPSYYRNILYHHLPPHSTKNTLRLILISPPLCIKPIKYLTCYLFPSSRPLFSFTCQKTITVLNYFLLLPLVASTYSQRRLTSFNFPTAFLLNGNTSKSDLSYSIATFI